MSYIVGNEEGWPEGFHFPGPPEIRRRMAIICERTESRPVVAVRLARKLVRECEDDEEIDNETLSEARNLLTDAENAVIKRGLRLPTRGRPKKSG